MTSTVEIPALSLRASLAKLIGAISRIGKNHPVEHWFDGDSVKTAFTLPPGWKAIGVSADGLDLRPGLPAWDYELTYDGFQWTATLDTAPTTYACILAVRDV